MRFSPQNLRILVFLLPLFSLMVLAPGSLFAQISPEVEYERWVQEMNSLRKLTQELTQKLEKYAEESSGTVGRNRNFLPTLQKSEAELRRRIMYSRALFSPSFPQEHRLILNAFLGEQKKYFDLKQKLWPPLPLGIRSPAQTGVPPVREFLNPATP